MTTYGVLMLILVLLLVFALNGVLFIDKADDLFCWCIGITVVSGLILLFMAIGLNKVEMEQYGSISDLESIVEKYNCQDIRYSVDRQNNIQGDRIKIVYNRGSGDYIIYLYRYIGNDENAYIAFIDEYEKLIKIDKED